jgi:hypothetical protein
MTNLLQSYARQSNFVAAQQNFIISHSNFLAIVKEFFFDNVASLRGNEITLSRITLEKVGD